MRHANISEKHRLAQVVCLLRRVLRGDADAVALVRLRRADDRLGPRDCLHSQKLAGRRLLQAGVGVLALDDLGTNADAARGEARRRRHRSAGQAIEVPLRGHARAPRDGQLRRTVEDHVIVAAGEIGVAHRQAARTGARREREIHALGGESVGSQRRA